MKVGDWVNTPRFLKVKIQEIHESVKDLRNAGYTEPTHYEGEYEIQGKNTGVNRMVFAATKKKEGN